MVSARSAAVRTLLAVAGLVALAAFVSPASGYHQGTAKAVDTVVSETVTIPKNNWTAYTFTLNAGDTINYDIRVTNGSAIDVYIVPPDGLSNYASDSAPRFRFYDNRTNTRTATGIFSGATGSVSVIIDNVDFTDAIPTGPVTVFVNITKSLGSSLFLGALIFLVCGVVLLAVAVIVLLVLRRRKAAALPPPPLPYGGTPPPYLAPPPPSPPTTVIQETEVARGVAQIPCKYCGSMVDPTARICPSCNAPLG